MGLGWEGGKRIGSVKRVNRGERGEGIILITS